MPGGGRRVARKEVQGPWFPKMPFCSWTLGWIANEEIEVTFTHSTNKGIAKWRCPISKYFGEGLIQLNLLPWDSTEFPF